MCTWKPEGESSLVEYKEENYISVYLKQTSCLSSHSHQFKVCVFLCVLQLRGEEGSTLTTALRNLELSFQSPLTRQYHYSRSHFCLVFISECVQWWMNSVQKIIKVMTVQKVYYLVVSELKNIYFLKVAIKKSVVLDFSLLLFVSLTYVCNGFVQCMCL